MPYTTKSEIEPLLPAADLVQALDDDNDGVEDPGLWDAIAAAAAAAVDGKLGQRYAVPFAAPYPAVVVEASKTFVMEMLFARRGVDSEKNPWAKRATEMRATLTYIATGDQPLAPEQTRPRPSVKAITEPSRTTDARGRLFA
jgi:phage gp36-like protein